MTIVEEKVEKLDYIYSSIKSSLNKKDYNEVYNLSMELYDFYDQNYKDANELKKLAKEKMQESGLLKRIELQDLIEEMEECAEMNDIGKLKLIDIFIKIFDYQPLDKGFI